MSELVDMTEDEETGLASDADYDDPQITEWVVSVDVWGSVSILEHPNIHHAFLEPLNAEEIGLDYEVDWTPGVYKLVCELHLISDWETNTVEEINFHTQTKEKLWPVTKENP